MAGRRVYGGSKMEIFLEHESIPTEAMDALLASGPSTTGFHGSRTMVSFERVHENMQKRPFFCPPELEETGDEDLDECFQQPEKKRRLTCNQVRFLEKTFEHENKLEPDKKLQLAKDLGLQQRQVAIWFQNRRARWKTKQLEKDYDSLKSSYNALKADYENLFKEKEKLKAEVNILTDKLLLEGKSISEPFEVPITESDWVSKEKGTADPMMVRKSQDLSSANSAVSESNSSQCTNRAQTSLHELAESSNAFETDQSDFSQGRDDGGAKGCDFLKLEDNPCNYGFSVEDQAFWFWPY